MDKAKKAREKKAETRAGKRVTKKELAEILGVSTRQIERYVSDGMPTDGALGNATLYDTAQAVLWLIAKAEGRIENMTDAQMLIHYKALQEKHAYEVTQGQHVELPAVEAWLENMILMLRPIIEAIPKRLMLDLAELADPQKQAVLDGSIREVLHGLERAFAEPPK